MPAISRIAGAAGVIPQGIRPLGRYTETMDRAEELGLIRRAKRGDREALVALIETHRRSLHHFLLRLSRREDVAEDIGQEALVRVLRHLDRFDERFRFSTWLFTIARRLWINHIQKFRPLSDTDTVGGRASVSDEAPELDLQELRAIASSSIDEAMDVLNPQQREVVDLFHRRGLPIQEIASRLAIPNGTVKSHLFRARRRLGAALADDDVFRSVAEDLGIDSDAVELLAGEARR